ncbi:hypothetical protein [Paenibacillus glycinis]|uniref:Transposase n=1 Tax=Paenibacillus glycinis TaxID=2697035 RepID=A0ABW9Y0S5_9BACL|nr:hypothetical protein [Paenibacillus glycinis]NBD28002.1 hypothetical protein [Paenibacillus glycinis]
MERISLHAVLIPLKGTMILRHKRRRLSNKANGEWLNLFLNIEFVAVYGG